VYPWLQLRAGVCVCLDLLCRPLQFPIAAALVVIHHLLQHSKCHSGLVETWRNFGTVVATKFWSQDLHQQQQQCDRSMGCILGTVVVELVDGLKLGADFVQTRKQVGMHMAPIVCCDLHAFIASNKTHQQSGDSIQPKVTTSYKGPCTITTHWINTNLVTYLQINVKKLVQRNAQVPTDFCVTWNLAAIVCWTQLSHRMPWCDKLRRILGTHVRKTVSATLPRLSRTNQCQRAA